MRLIGAWCRAFLAVALLAAPAVPLRSAAPESIRVVMDQDYPPYIFKAPDGSLRGILVDEWKLWERKTGIQARLSALDWAEAQRRMAAGEFDVIDTMFVNEARRALYDFGPPYARIDVPIFFHKDLSGISDPKDLGGFVIGAKRGDNVLDILRGRGVASFALFDNYQQIAEAARDGKVKVFTVDRPPALYYLNRMGILDRFRESPPLYSGDFHRAVRKGQKALLDLVQGGFARITPEEHREIERRWLGAPLAIRRDLRLAAFIALGMTGALLLLGAWVGSLRRVVRKRTEELRSSEDLTGMMLENLPVMLFLKDARELRFLRFNRAGEEMLGWPRESILGHNDFDFFPPEQAAFFTAKDREVLEGGKILDIPEERIRTSGGAIRILHTRKVPLHGPDGAPRYLMGISEDITERKAQELELLRKTRLYDLLSRLGQCLVRVQNREELFEESCAIAAQAGDYPLVWIAWGDPRTSAVRAAAMAGACAPRLREEIGRLDLTPEGGSICATSILEGTTVVIQDYSASRAGASMKAWMERAGLRAGIGVPIRLRGAVAGSFLVFSGEPGAFQPEEVDLLKRAAGNISFGLDRFEMEAEKARLQELLHHSQKMESLGTLAGGIAHDMNNVLGAILALASSNLEAQPPGSALRRALETIAKAATRGGQMVKGLLDFARKGHLKEETIDLNALVKDVATLLERSTLKRVQVAFDLDPDLRPIKGDPSSIAHALMNLYVNAVDAMAGEGTLTLASRNRAQGIVEVSVGDTGSGMAPDVARQAMDPFFTTKPQGKGTGLGLPIVYGVVQAHLGEMRIQSEPGRGTLVILQFPAAPPASAGEPEVPEPPSPAALSPLRVLVVDDDDAVRAAVEDVLRSGGHQSRSAASGEEALAALATGAPPDVILLDLNMPGLGGAEALRELRGFLPRTPVLLISGKADLAAQRLARSYARVALLPKPFTAREILERMAALVAG